MNFYQKKVDRSLVADLFPTARGKREKLTEVERAQDLGRKLMLDTGPLVGMVQIPGIKYGVADVVTLATLNAAIEDVLPDMDAAELTTLEEQAEFLAICLDAWLDATRRRQDIADDEKLDPENVAYQGRVLVSFLTLVPACIEVVEGKGSKLISDNARESLTGWVRKLLDRAGLLKDGKFLSKSDFKTKGYLGSGGLARFRDTLWAAAFARTKLVRLRPETIAVRASEARAAFRRRKGTE